jgi:molecular chaperone GrpE
VAAGTVAPQNVSAGAPAVESPTAPEDELALLRREVAELRDKNLRLMAELQNQQKRAQREKQEAQRFAEAELARALLNVLDDLERAQEAARSAQDAQAVAEGVRLVSEHFLKVLRDHHVAPIEALGRPFDPAFHEAMLQQPSAEQAAGTVLQEIARGYTMHERVLRPSRVVVSSGPPVTDTPAGGAQEKRSHADV